MIAIVFMHIKIVMTAGYITNDEDNDGDDDNSGTFCSGDDCGGDLVIMVLYS